MSVMTKRRTPGPGQLVLVLPGLPAPAPTAPRQRPARPPVRTATPRPPTPAGYVTPRPHGPVKARQMPGELHGAAQTSRQVREILLKFQQTPDGRWRITQPRIPAFVAVASNAAQLVVAIRSGFTEAQVAAYADWQNTAYDADVPTYRRRRPKRSEGKKVRKDVHPFDAWKLTGELDQRGIPLWQSPGAKRLSYPEDCQVVQRVIAKREKAGLARRPELPPPDREDVRAMVKRSNVVDIRRGKTA